MTILQDVRYIKGVGPKRAEVFRKIGIESVKDLLCLFPRRYEDRTQFRTISELQLNEYVTISGVVQKTTLRRIKRNFAIFDAVINDGTGVIKATWFNQPYLVNAIPEGRRIVLSGMIERFRGVQMKSPEYEIIDEDDDTTIHTNRIVPIYPLREGLRQKQLRKTLFQLVSEHAGAFHEYLSDDCVEKYGFPSISETLTHIHFPETFDQLEKARARIVYEEFLLFELDVVRRLRAVEACANQYPVVLDRCDMDSFYEALPFRFTDDQAAAFDDIVGDMSGPHVMNRLMQGDVGSGKTVVACATMYAAVRSGYQAAFLIPTEILAEQHFNTLQRVLAPFDMTVDILTGSAKKKEREAVIARVARGEVDILVGTHALLEDVITFNALGLVVIDEQHKFGVLQRAALTQKTEHPHVLVMTATPIPRTLGLTVYGDLQISVIRSLPQGRKPIKTYWVEPKKIADMYTFLKKRIAAGEQVYILFPLVAESEKVDLKAATEEYERLRATIFSSEQVGLIHGRMKKDEKDAVMQAFLDGTISVLVTTTVIEVGIDNPHATGMVIEHAERFGLSQLHQLRGRVGRGRKESYCFLVGEPRTEEGRTRLSVMTRTTDGFVIAEEDLRLRGPGDFLGTRQSGLPLFLLANIVTDQEILSAARDDAFLLLEKGEDKALCDTIVFSNKKTSDIQGGNN